MFKNMKLAVKIGGGFAIVLILTTVVGFIGWSGMNGVVDRVDKAHDVNRLVKYMLESRQQERNYIIRGDAEYIENVSKIISDIKEQTAVTLSEERALEDGEMVASARAVQAQAEEIRQEVRPSPERGP